MRKPKTAESLKPLAEKLCCIRSWKNLSQSEILRIVYPEIDETQRSLISQWENATREPGRQILIRYAKLAKITLEELLVDEIDLPAHISEANCHQKGNFQKNSHAKDNKEDKDVEETNDVLTDQVDETDRKVEPKFIELPFSIGKKPSEAVTIDLPIDLLDELDDVHFELIKQTPRALRHLITVENIIGFGVKVILYQHSQIGRNSLLADQVKTLIDSCDLQGNNDN